MFRMKTAFLKKAANILTTIGFFAAAVFLAAILWIPADVAPSSTTLDVQASLFLALDKPQARARKLHLSDLLSLINSEVDLADLPQPDLTTELNNWTYTQGDVLGDLFQIKTAVLFSERAGSRARSLFLFEGNIKASEMEIKRADYWSTYANLYRLYLLRDLGLGFPLLPFLINQVQMELNSLSQYR